MEKTNKQQPAALRRLNNISSQLTGVINEEEAGALKINENLVAVPMVIPFDGHNNPILNNDKHKSDYYFLKEILTDSSVMKTSSLNGGKAYNEDQEQEMNSVIHSLVRTNEEDRSSKHGVYKVYDKDIDEFIGVQGMINTNRRVEGKKIVELGGKLIVESATLIRSPYISKGYGTAVINWSAKEAEKRGESVFATIRGDNIKCMQVASDQEMYYLGSEEKFGNIVNMYGKDFIQKSEMKKMKNTTVVNRVSSRQSPKL